MPRSARSCRSRSARARSRCRTRADRIEQRRDGSYAILDYKTGSTPTEKQVRTGLSPQLTLEGAILRQGGFTEIAGGSISEVAYVALRGGEPAGEQRPIEFKEGTPDAMPTGRSRCCVAS